MPTRGNIEKIGIRVEASPVSRPCQYGELAESASSSGRYSRIPSSARTARTGSGTPTCTCSAKVGSRCASARIESSICRYRGSGAISTSFQTAVGCVPATAERRPWPASARASSRRSPPSSAIASATVRCGSVASSTTQAWVSAEA